MPGFCASIVVFILGVKLCNYVVDWENCKRVAERRKPNGVYGLRWGKSNPQDTMHLFHTGFSLLFV